MSSGVRTRALFGSTPRVLPAGGTAASCYQAPGPEVCERRLLARAPLTDQAGIRRQSDEGLCPSPGRWSGDVTASLKTPASAPISTLCRLLRISVHSLSGEPGQVRLSWGKG